MSALFLLALSAAAQAQSQAPSWGGLRDTAGTLPAGAWAVRLPTGRTAIGVRDGTEVWAQPIGLGFAGSRVGLEQTVLDTGAWVWSLSPSVGATWSLLEGAAALHSYLSYSAGSHRINLTAAGRGRILRQARLSDEREHTLSADRLLVPVSVAYDHQRDQRIWRTRLMVAVADEGEALTYGTLSTHWIRAIGRLHLDLGVGVFAGQPSEHIFLGRYSHTLVSLYPSVDLWWAL